MKIKMKKIYTLLFATLGISVAATAQREMDLGVVMTTPAAGFVFNSGSPLDIATVITNNGPEALEINDSVFVQYYVGTSLLTFNLNGSSVTTFYFKTTRQVPIGDTVHFSPSFPGLTFPAAMNGQSDFCVLVIPVNRTIDSIVDRTPANNMACNMITFANGQVGSGVNSITWANGVNTVNAIYPNPATTEANFVVELAGRESVSVKVVDLAGRVVLAEDKGVMAEGEQTIRVNTSGVAAGLYIYQITMGKNTISGKLNIAK
jgi:hypothetical protein